MNVSAFMSCSYITIFFGFQQETIFAVRNKICFIAPESPVLRGFLQFFLVVIFLSLC